MTETVPGGIDCGQGGLTTGTWTLSNLLLLNLHQETTGREEGGGGASDTLDILVMEMLTDIFFSFGPIRAFIETENKKEARELFCMPV